MSEIVINNKEIRTDLISEQKLCTKKKNLTYKKNGIKVLKSTYKRAHYTTIIYNDITDSSNYNNLKEIFKIELKKYINDNDIYLIIGLGNSSSTPDSLGPKVIDQILVTRYLYEFNNISSNYSNVAAYKPDVVGNTGIESLSIIKSIIKDIKPTKVIIIDSLKANNIDHLVKTIQITDKGINPGSGIFNDRGEISKKTMKTSVVAVGIPTIVDLNSIANQKTSYMLTPTNIDFIIDRLSKLIATSINEILHKHLIDK